MVLVLEPSDGSSPTPACPLDMTFGPKMVGFVRGAAMSFASKIMSNKRPLLLSGLELLRGGPRVSTYGLGRTEHLIRPPVIGVSRVSR